MTVVNVVFWWTAASFAAFAGWAAAVYAIDAWNARRGIVVRVRLSPLGRLMLLASPSKRRIVRAFNAPQDLFEVES